MKSIKQILSFCTLLGLMVAGLTSSIHAQTEFKAHLSGSNEVPTIVTTAEGTITAMLTGTELSIEGSFSGLSGDFAASHIHIGMAGTNGGVLVALSATLDEDSRGGTFIKENNTFTLEQDQIDILHNQGHYINIHSSNYPGGELRGQLVQNADAYFRANLSGAFEVPAVKSTASGAVVAQVVGDTLFLSGSFNNLSGNFAASHLHLALAGANGGVAFPLMVDTKDDLTSGEFLPSHNKFEVNSDQKMALMNREMYVNVHTSAYASGELRGQLTPPVTAAFYGSLSSSAEIPSVNENGTGALVIELTGDSLFASGSFNGLSSAFAASHLHQAHAGANGGVAVPLTVSTSDNDTAGSFPVTGNSFELNADQKMMLVDRAMYVNVHSANYAGGELRAQVLGDATAYFKTKLSGLNEVQPIISSGVGALNLELSGSNAIITGGFSGLTSSFDSNVAGGAHLHAASVSNNGGIAVMLATTVTENDTAGVYEADLNTAALTEEQISTLFDEGMYANIHTTGFGSGELRGQLLFGDNFFPSASMITSPADGASLTVSGESSTPFEATWSTATDANEIAYIWQLATDAEFTNLLVNANVGADTSFVTDFGVLDSILEGLGVELGTTATVYHRALASDGGNQSIGAAKTANLERGQVVSNEELGFGNPQVFELQQNYPNPFNPSTNITFSLAEAGIATLKIYSLIGQEVATIANSRFSAGQHTVQFDARSLSSGVYIYRLSSNNSTITKRMTLIK